MPNLIFDKKNVIVTGGAGFIGSHLVEELIKHSKVICIDNLITGNESNIDYLLRFPNFKFINHDITKPIDLEQIPELEDFKINFQGIQEVYHLACPSSPVAIDTYPIETSLTNVYGTKNILDIVTKYKSKLFFSSSSYVYGLTPDNLKYVSESYVGPYDHTEKRASYVEGKKMAETLVLDYQAKHNLNVKIGRVFNIYGPRMKPDDGRIIPDMIMKALNNEDLIIPGDENLQNSFCFVEDLVEAILKLMEIEGNLIVNMGNQESVTLTTVAKKIIELTNSKSQFKYTTYDKKALKSIVPDISLIKEKIGWFPITLISTGLEVIVKDIEATKHLVGYYSR
jgi:UDP-glucuronate decarboxylase